MSERYGAIMFLSDDFIRDSAIDYRAALIWSVQGRAKRDGHQPLDDGAEVEEMHQRFGLEDWEHGIPEGCRAFRVTVRVEPRDEAPAPKP